MVARLVQHGGELRNRRNRHIYLVKLRKRKAKARRRNPDNRERRAVEVNLAADHARAAAKLFLPHGVAQHRDTAIAMFAFCRADQAAQRGLHVHHAEEVRRHTQRMHRYGLRACLQVRCRLLVARDIEHLRAVVAPELVLRPAGGLRVAFGRNRLDRHQPRHMPKRQRPHQHCIENAEHRRRKPHSQRKRQHRRQCKSGCAAQLTQRIAHVRSQPVAQS